MAVLRIPYVDDPTNADTAYDRVRMRKLLDRLEDDGLGRMAIADTSARMRRAAEALGRRAHEVAMTLSRVEAGDVVIARDPFAAIESDTQLRILAAALQFVSSAEYRPRAEALETVLDRMLAGGSSTLHGCRIDVAQAEVRLSREYAALAGCTVTSGAVWDRRWRIGGTAAQGLSVRALGEEGRRQARAAGVAAIPDHVLSAPALWRDARLVACRRVGFGPDYTEKLDPPGGDFPARLIAH
jgi:tRNA(Ile)-lysidine synthase